MRLLCALFLTILCVEGTRVKIQETKFHEEAGEGTQALQEGETFLDRYLLISKVKDWPRDIRGFTKVSYLGKGAFGETWLAFDQTSQKNVAVKFFYRSTRSGVVLLNMQKANPQEKSALREAGTECDTPTNIVNGMDFPAGKLRFAQCYSNAVNDRNYAHLVLEVAGTQNLEEYVASNRVGSADIKRIALMMIEGLVQMEGRYVHRDIKPANIMVYKDAEDGQLYLRYIDFGLTVTEGARAGVAGTPMFLPPDMWPVVPRDPVSDHKFDVYSAGETLYWLICGQTFHEAIFDKYGHFAERQLAEKLQNTDPRTACRPRETLQNLAEVVIGGMMPARPRDRIDATELITNSVFSGISTMKEVVRPPAARPRPDVRPAVPEPAAEIMQPVAPQAPQRTFLDDCHEDKRFWFKNANRCCLAEKYDLLRDAICRRPCGPKVVYSQGQCQHRCDLKGDGTQQFNEELQCCVASVWRTKCNYPDRLPEGEGWKWQKA